MSPHVTERLSAYMDEELAAEERGAVEAHLRGCAACARHLEELKAVEAAARALPLDVPDGYFEAFPGRVRQRLAPARRRRYHVPAWIGAAAAAVVLALLTPRLLREPRAPVAPHAPAPAATLAATRATAEPPAPPQAAAAKKDSRLRDAEARLPGRPQAPAAAPAPAAPAPERAQKAARAPSAGGYAAPPEVLDQVEGVPAESAPEAMMEAESGTLARREETGERRDKAAATSSTEARFDLLLHRTVTSVTDARALRDAWRALARDEATGRRADEARVRAIEAGVEAWRRGKGEADRAEALREGREYLARPDALQAGRVRAALRTLSP
jgi:anti-sigma factor RsiW